MCICLGLRYMIQSACVLTCMCMVDLTCHHLVWMCLSVCILSLKVTAQQLYSHGDGVHPASGDDSDETGENRRVDVVLHVFVVICISQKSLDLVRERERHCLV